MKIALIGYGKMGKAIEQIAIARGHEIGLKIGSQNQNEFTTQNLNTCDVAIEFSTPATVLQNVNKCIEAKIPLVCGTTAWLKHLPEVHELVKQNNTSFIYASNFSVGVNIFFNLNKKLAGIMAKHNAYKPSITEVHHTQKLDAPSGTAITIAEGIVENYTTLNNIVNHASNNPNDLSIISQRIDPAPGTHTVHYKSVIDDIEITHTAHSRDGFATGAVLAAEYIYNKVGIFTMQDVLDL